MQSLSAGILSKASERRTPSPGSSSMYLSDFGRFPETQGDELGQTFRRLELHDREKSPLVSRNQSILAHGFVSIGEASFQKLREAVLKLAQVQEWDLPVFPKLCE